VAGDVSLQIFKTQLSGALRRVLDAAIAGEAKAGGKRIAAASHYLQVQNELLCYEADGRRTALTTK
jgi:hypothetical protein